MAPRLNPLVLCLLAGTAAAAALGLAGCSPLIYVLSGGGPDELHELEVGTPFHGTTARSHDDYAPRCAGTERSPDAAHRLEVAATGRYLVQVQADYDAVVAVYAGEELVSCNDDHGDRSQAQVIVDLDSTRTYIVVVDGWGGTSGDYGLSVEHRRPPLASAAAELISGATLPPREDVAALEARCADAEDLPPGRSTGVLIPSDAHAVVGCGAGGRGPEAIYRVEVPERTRLEVEVTSELDAVVELRRGCSRGHEVLACVDDAPDPTHTALSADLIPGTTYFLIIDSYAPDAGGPFELEVTFTPREHEDAP